MARVLAVDTSSERGSVCILEDGAVLGEVRLACSVQHSERLFKSIEFLLAWVPFGLADIDVFAAARGPGSFTGLRLGLAAMEGFAAAHGKPGAGVSTLEALAWKSGVTDRPIASVIDARRGEVYGAVYRRAGDILEEVRAPEARAPAEWFAALPEGPLALCGDGLLRYGGFVNRAAWSMVAMDLYIAGAVGRLALSAIAGPLAPLYVRRSEAEVRRERAS
jgi:tRNA threonylcarbamoyladenosine biosynthesis protein TsaB